MDQTPRVLSISLPLIALTPLLSNIGVVQTKESTKFKNPQEKNTISEGKKEIAESFRITSPFGWRVDPITVRWALHQGVDISGKRGSPILAAAKGWVCKANQQANLGYLLAIDHGNGYVSSYGHLDSFALREGGLDARGAAHCYSWKHWEEFRPPLTL